MQPACAWNFTATLVLPRVGRHSRRGRAGFPVDRERQGNSPLRGLGRSRPPYGLARIIHKPWRLASQGSEEGGFQGRSAGEAGDGAQSPLSPKTCGDARGAESGLFRALAGIRRGGTKGKNLLAHLLIVVQVRPTG